MQSLETIRIFVKVAEMASFTRAAESLNMQKGRVSIVIRELETKVGVRLLHRTTRNVHLTEDGKSFLARAQNLLADSDELESMFNASEMKGTLRIDLPTEVARSTIIPCLPALMDSHPLLELELSCTDRRVDLVQEGFDGVLRIGQVGDESLVAISLGQLRMCNAASPEYLRRYGIPLEISDLQGQGHRTVHYTRRFGTKPDMWEYPLGNDYATLSLPGRLHVNSVQAYHAAGLAGMGLIQAPLSGIGHHLASGALVEVLPDFRAAPLPVFFVVAHQRNLSRRLRTLVAWLEQVLEPYLD
ncbi:LysR family transcriptional regulator [Pseudomonas sp. NPDC089569]|uniref:LysR family transcriptional regulator n=1 Tax=Pseudomonas sp. NPDC089569 TaxID=3390722 RepID=UPI003D036FB5